MRETNEVWGQMNHPVVVEQTVRGQIPLAQEMELNQQTYDDEVPQEQQQELDEPDSTCSKFESGKQQEVELYGDIVGQVQEPYAHLSGVGDGDGGGGGGGLG